MTLEELGAIMSKEGLVIRAIPETVTSIFDANEKNKALYPDGVVQFLPEYNREMLVVKKTPECAGKFIFTRCNSTGTRVLFPQQSTMYNSLSDVVDAIQKKYCMKE